MVINFTALGHLTINLSISQPQSMPQIQGFCAKQLNYFKIIKFMKIFPIIENDMSEIGSDPVFSIPDI